MSSLKKKLRILHNRKVEAEKQALAETKIEDFEDKMKRLRDRKKQKSFEE